MKKLSISDLQPDVSFTFDRHDPFYYVVSFVLSEPVYSPSCKDKILVRPYIVCFAILKKNNHLYTSQFDIPFDLLEMVDFYAYPLL